MKLRQRIGLLSGVVLLCIMALCAGFLFFYTRRTILNITREQAINKQANLSNSFSSMARYYVAPTDSDAAHESLIRYCFSRFADEEGVLMCEGEVLISSVSVVPSDYIENREEMSPAVYNGVIGGRNVLIVTGKTYVRNFDYTVSIVRDVTDMYADIARLGWLFVAVCTAGVLLGSALLYGVVRRGLLPLSRLTAVANEIAEGAYDRRVRIETKDEVRMLADSFNRMADAVQTRIHELSEQNLRQKLFIGGLTHEFKTPLAALRLHSDLLGGANLNDAERARSLSHIAKQSAYMDAIVQNLLKLLLLEDDIETEPTAPSALLADVTEAAGPSLAARGVRLITDCQRTEPLSVNPTLIRSLLLNLVENAARSYDPDAPDKTVTLAATRRGFSVTDHGRGIPESALSHIFDPFYRVDKSRSKKQGGSGLGLALVKAIADAHGASLLVDSASGRGTAFYVVF